MPFRTFTYSPTSDCSEYQTRDPISRTRAQCILHSLHQQNPNVMACSVTSSQIVKDETGEGFLYVGRGEGGGDKIPTHPRLVRKVLDSVRNDE